MFFGCGCGFGRPKKGSDEFDDPPTLIKTIEEEDHSPTVGTATLVRFFKSKQVHIDRSMSPSPESMVKSGAQERTGNWEEGLAKTAWKQTGLQKSRREETGAEISASN